MLVAALLATACGTGASGEPGSASSSDTPATTSPQAPPQARSQAPPEPFFPTLRALNAAVPEARLEGKLALDEKGCLLIQPPPVNKAKFPGANIHKFPGTVPLWPAYYRLETEKGEVRVLDEDGRVVARVGERVSMGGGEIAAETIRGNDLMGEQELRELSERCPDDYWMVGEGTHIPGRRG